MMSLRKPSAAAIRRFLEVQGSLDFTYTAIGGTAGMPPGGYVIDHTRVRLGEGQRVFEAAKNALRQWDQFRLGWLEAGPDTTPIQKGEVVAVAAHAVGLWWLNACRIVAVWEDSETVHHGRQAVRRFGFAYGTLPDHAGTGEERFLVEWDSFDNSVWYDILAFSRPQQLLIRLGYPLVRRLQKRFGRESAAAMQKAVA